MTPDIESALVAQLMTNQENFIKKNKTILDVARENFKKRKKNNARRTTSKRNGKTNFSAFFFGMVV